MDTQFLWSNPEDEYLKTLRSKYPIQDIAGNVSNLEKILNLSEWVQSLWTHNGLNEPKKNDPLSILEEVEKGVNFRCVEYAEVLRGCLNAIGIHTRKLGLRTEDVETREYGAGHVVVEAYLKDLGKWVFVDPQWNALPILNGIPLCAVEFRDALKNGQDVECISNQEENSRYFEWIFPYLYYFNTNFDQRVGRDPEKVDGYVSLMLVPNGAKNPTVFQRIHPIKDVLYINDESEFYGSPY